MSHTARHLPPLRQTAIRVSARAAVLALALFVAGLFLVYGTIVGARLAGFGVAVTRGSVDASIPSGSVVIGRWIRPDDVRTGQQVIFEERHGVRAEPPRLRRIVDIETRDGNLVVRTRDTALAEAQYVIANPVVEPVLTLRLVGYILALLLTPLGWLFGFAVPAGVLAFIALWYVWRPEEEPAPLGLAAPAYSPPRA